MGGFFTGSGERACAIAVYETKVATTPDIFSHLCVLNLFHLFTSQVEQHHVSFNPAKHCGNFARKGSRTSAGKSQLHGLLGENQSQLLAGITVPHRRSFSPPAYTTYILRGQDELPHIFTAHPGFLTNPIRATSRAIHLQTMPSHDTAQG